jgi:two-component system chemotaxis response regulator CheY
MEKQKFDIVLTDWNMPEMNGEQFVKELRSNEKYKKLPILMITTRGMKDDVITAVKLGVNGYVVKPFTPEILKGKINDVISKL